MLILFASTNFLSMAEAMYSKVPKHIMRYLVVVVIAASFYGGYLLGANQTPTKSTTQEEKGGALSGTKEPLPSFLSKDVEFSLLWDVWKLVKQDYVEKNTPDTKLFYGALAGVVAALGDPYSVFFDPETAKRFDEELSGSFEGIGAEIGMKNNQIIIIAPLSGTPAEKAGLLAGDKIIAIDKKSTANMSVDLAVSLIRGKGGTNVTLSIYRDGNSQEHDVIITRDTIQVASVKWEMKEGGVGYIKISHFNKDTLEKFKEAVKDLLAKKATKLVIDLRNNPGGFLDTAVEVAGYWIDGKPAVIEKFDEKRKKEYRAQSRAILKDIPTVVLVNQGSASASEIVAGALQDYERAKLVGMTTFGKGSVQDLKPLPDGSAVKITVAKWLTPKERSIHEVGIKPDFEVELKKEDIDSKKDPQMEKAMELLK